MTRALWASLGAGTGLVLMGVGILVAVSAVIGFKGWPGASNGVGSTPQAMLAPDGPLAGINPIRATATIVLPEARRTGRQQPRARVRPIEAAARDAAPRTVRVATPTPGSDRDTAGSDREVSTVKPAPKDEPKAPGEPVRQVGNDLGAATETTVKDLGQVVESLSPTLGKAVGDIGAVVGDTVQGVTNTVSDVLDGALKPSP